MNDRTEHTLYRQTYGCEIVLSPSDEYAAIVSSYENAFGLGVEHDMLTVISLRKHSIKKIDVAPDALYGVVE